MTKIAHDAKLIRPWTGEILEEYSELEFPLGCEPFGPERYEDAKATIKLFKQNKLTGYILVVAHDDEKLYAIREEDSWLIEDSPPCACRITFKK